jgi:hypothetical protein
MTTLIRPHAERQFLADCVEKLRKCQFSDARRTGCWARSGTQALLIDRHSSAREFFNKIGTFQKYAERPQWG